VSHHKHRAPGTHATTAVSDGGPSRAGLPSTRRPSYYVLDTNLKRRRRLIARARRQRTDRLGGSTFAGRITRTRSAFLGFLACAPTMAVRKTTSAVASGMAVISNNSTVIRGWDRKSALLERIGAKSHRHAADYRTGTPREGSPSVHDQVGVPRSATCALRVYLLAGRDRLGATVGGRSGCDVL